MDIRDIQERLRKREILYCYYDIYTGNGVMLKAEKARPGRQEGVYPEKVVALVGLVRTPFGRVKLRAPGWGACEAVLEFKIVPLPDVALQMRKQLVHSMHTHIVKCLL